MEVVKSPDEQHEEQALAQNCGGAYFTAEDELMLSQTDSEDSNGENYFTNDYPSE